MVGRVVVGALRNEGTWEGCQHLEVQPLTVVPNIAYLNKSYLDACIIYVCIECQLKSPE